MGFFGVWNVRTQLQTQVGEVFFLIVCLLLNQAARARGVDCLVAPYEADAQLAYLTKSGLAQAVITEDSDLLAFGCKTVCSAVTEAVIRDRQIIVCVEVKQHIRNQAS